MAVYRSLDSPKLGAWWSAIIIIITTILSLISNSRGVVIAAMVFGIIAVIVGIIGCAVDGIGNSIVNSLTACVSDTGVVSGDSGSFVAIYCTGFTDSCACIQTNNVDTCFLYNGGLAADDCDNILTVYTSRLHGAVAFDIIATLGVFVISILTCVTICCPQSLGGAQPTAAGQVVTTGQPQPQQQVQYGNTQGVVVTGVVVGQAQPVQNNKY